MGSLSIGFEIKSIECRSDKLYHFSCAMFSVPVTNFFHMFVYLFECLVMLENSEILLRNTRMNLENIIKIS